MLVTNVLKAMARAGVMLNRESSYWSKALADRRPKLLAALFMVPRGEPRARLQYVEMLNRNVLSVGHILLQLTDYARLEAGQDKITLGEFDAAGLARECLALAQPLAHKRRMILRGDGPDRLLVHGDAPKAQRILQNLLDNALKSTKSGKHGH